MSTSLATRSTVFFISFCGVHAFSSAKAMSSPTVRPMNWPSGSCSTVPTCADSSKMPALGASTPSTVNSPFTSPGKENGIRPLMQLPSVLLPLPEGPAISTRSPGRMLRLIPWSVGRFCARYWNEKSLKDMIGVVMVSSSLRSR